MCRAKRTRQLVRGCIGRSYVVKDARCQYCKLRQQSMIADCSISVKCLDLQHGDLVKIGNGFGCMPVKDHRSRDLFL